MKKSVFAIYLVFIFNISLLVAQPKQSPIQVDKISFKTLEKHLQNDSDTVFVVNFWATWCGPCVAELPAFISAFGQYKNKPVRFLMVNLDFPDNYNKMVKFVAARPDFPPAVWLDDQNYNAWISKVETSWEGQIPATLIYNNHQKYRLFVSGMIAEKKLKKAIEAGIIK